MNEKMMIANLIQDNLDRRFFPQLYIGASAYNLRKELKGKYIVTLETVADIKNFLDEYYKSQIESIVFIQDISRIDLKYQDLFLKFLEESELKLVLISSFDRIRPTLRSRVKIVFKSNYLPVKSALRPVKEYSLIDDAETEQKKTEIMQDFPLVYFYRHKFSHLSPKIQMKLFNLL